MLDTTTQTEIEKIYIIQPIFGNDYKALQKEAEALIESAGAVCAGTIYQNIKEINPATFIGPGKLTELKERLSGLSVTVLFNGDLTPSQTLNISAALSGLKVIDRTTLILDIFARNAKSNEGKLQVELAQLKYLFPRLRGKGIGLSRLGGGIGTRGPGETKLETDRRKIRLRISHLQDKIDELATRRKLTTERRRKNNANTIALIGYTNVGKSTLLNRLTESEVYADDRLFATLDTTSRKLLINTREFILTDTVGFLRELPHHLISAFQSTLESALRCDLLLLVCDASSDYEMQLNTTLSVLKDLDCRVPYLLVMNKSENMADHAAFPSNSIFVSAKTGAGTEKLKAEILRFFNKENVDCTLQVPYTSFSDYVKLKKMINELSVQFKDEYIEIRASIPNIYINKFSRYRI